MSRHETDALLDKPPKAPNQARRGLALEIVVALCGAAALAVALPRTNSGGLRASPVALKADALKSGLVKDVDKSRWAPECLAWWQMVGTFPTSANQGDFEAPDEIEVSTYDTISMPAGMCFPRLFCAFENCGVSLKIPQIPSKPNRIYQKPKIKRKNIRINTFVLSFFD